MSVLSRRCLQLYMYVRHGYAFGIEEYEVTRALVRNLKLLLSEILIQLRT